MKVTNILFEDVITVVYNKWWESDCISFNTLLESNKYFDWQVKELINNDERFGKFFKNFYREKLEENLKDCCPVYLLEMAPLLSGNIEVKTQQDLHNFIEGSDNYSLLVLFEMYDKDEAKSFYQEIQEEMDDISKMEEIETCINDLNNDNWN